MRGQTSVLVDGTLLLDCGSEVPRAAERVGADLTGLRHVLITHAHPDHCSPAFLLFRSWVGDAPLDVVGPADVIEQARMWVAPDSPVRFVTVSPATGSASATSTSGCSPPEHEGDAVLYDVSTTDARLLYATDTGPLPQAHAGRGHGGRVRRRAAWRRRSATTRRTAPTTSTWRRSPSSFAGCGWSERSPSDTDLVAIHLSHHNPPTPELDRLLSAWGARTVADGSTIAEVGVVDGRDPRRRRRGVRSSTRRAGAASLSTRCARWSSVAPAPGKSREAERLLAAEPEVTYVATSYPVGDDPEWTERVRRHQADRPAHWKTVETLDLVDLLGADGGPLLVDCLTLWLTRVMDAHHAWDDGLWASRRREGRGRAEMDALVAAWRTTGRRVVAVTNEVGQGVVPDTASGRRFRDLMGRLNARLAAETEDVRWCVAGRVVRL